MNHYVPDFEMDEDSSIPPNSTLNKLSGEDEIMELVWQNNAPVAVNPLNQPPLPKSSSSLSSPSESAVTPPLPQNQQLSAPNNQLYMAEDEMTSWLHNPLEELYRELLYPDPGTTLPPPTTARPPAHRASPTDNRALQYQPPIRLPDHLAPPLQPPPTAVGGFPLFSRMVGSGASEPLAKLRSVSTVVDSNDTPITSRSTPVAAAVVTSKIPTTIPGVGESLVIGEGGAEVTKTSTSSSSATNSATATATGEAGVRTVTSKLVDRKRKSREIEESVVATTTTTTAIDSQYEEVELESGDEKKHTRGSSASKRTRAAEVHNLSERRRRDRINEKMKALQELIPRCNKSDKASMLDEAIEYLKSLQMQVQMMSMGCGMVPMMYPGMQQQYRPPGMQQQYVPLMGMGMGMGMGMDIDMGMTRPVVPYGAATPSPALPAAPAANTMPPLAPRMPVPPFAIPLVPSPQLSVNQPSIPADSSGSSYALPSPAMLQIPNMTDPYQQYLAYQQLQMQMQMQMQMQAVQSQTLSQPGSSKPDPSKSEGDNEDDIQ